MPTIKAVCFDLDGTLMEDKPLGSGAVLRASEAVAAMRETIDPTQLSTINRDVFQAGWRETEKAFVEGTRSGDNITREIWRRTLAELGLDDPDIVQTAFDVFTREVIGGYQLHDDAVTALDALAHLPLAVITNGASAVQRRKLVATGIEVRFRAVLVSGELGAPKPDRRIFLRASELLSTPTDEMLHVGDLLESDVDGALNAGLTAVWLNRHGKTRAHGDPTPHHEIASLSELPGLLDV